MLLTNDDIKDVTLLAKRLRTATVLHAVPALMHQLLAHIKREENQEDYAQITDLFVGGDKVPTAVLQEMQTVFPNANIHVLYGPTESTIFIAVKSYFNREKHTYNGSILGKPLPDVQIYILDQKQQLVPKGVTGEICVGGIRVAKGYLNQKELTGKQFIEHPWVKGERIYRTGDLGRWLRDGQLEFMGRSDDQVKIRGYRIELGEIESTLLKIDQIESVAAKIWKNVNGENEITAYFSSNRAYNVNDLNTELKKSLPDYMLPQNYVQLDELPLSHNGKVDYKSLQNPVGISLSGGADFLPPRNELEEKIVKIWRAVLNREKIGVLDDFFHLGGHSLKVLRLRNQFQKELDVNVSLKQLFTCTTIADQAQLAEAKNPEKFVRIEPIERQKNYPISDAQRRLWVLSQFSEGSVAYNMPGTFPLAADLDLECFQNAITAVIQRHEILRTVFKADETGEIKQWVLSSETIETYLPIVELEADDSADHERLIQQFIEKEASVSFDLERGPLFRMAIINVDQTQRIFYYNLHHIISDGWSMTVLENDVVRYYEAFLSEKQERSFKFPEPLRIQYKDYAFWQLKQLESAAFTEHRDFWKKQLQGELPVLDFPGHKKRPRSKTFSGRLLRTYIDQSTGTKLNQFVDEQGGSVFMGLLAAWNVLSYRYAGHKDTIVGTPTANRDHSDLENQIGFYANTLALRNNVDPSDTFEEFYQRVKTNTLEAFNHQMYPFDRLVEDLEVQHDTSRNALFEVMLVLQNNQEKRAVLSTQETSSLNEQTKYIADQGGSMSKFDIVINFQEIGDYLSFDLVYNVDIYTKKDMERLMFHFKQLLGVLLEHPKANIGTLNFLSENERDLLLEGFNNTHRTYPIDQTISDLVEVQAKRTPDRIAIEAEGQQLSYQALNETANQLAHLLMEINGVVTEDLIGINLPRGIDYVVAMLAVLKAGGCNAPINRSLGDETLERIAADFKLIINKQFIDTFRQNQSKYPKMDAKRGSGVNNLAYVIYTSGSTGQPKGCMLEHKGIVNHLFSKINVLELRNDSVIVHASKMCFVGGIWQLWAPLLVGGKVVVPSLNELQDIRALLNIAERYNVRAFEVIPSQIDTLVKLGQNNIQLGTIEQLILTGEPLKRDLIERILFTKPSIEIINTYGQTECSDVTTSYHITTDKSWNHRLVGRPIQNTKHFILDENQMCCAIGVIGEIYTAGPGVSRGYLNEPEQTEKAFLINEKITNQRLYRTGDLGRWTENGEVEIFGRADHQIKIRGYRIELGEIEQALLKQSEVAEAVVVVLENQALEKELVAYLTWNDIHAVNLTHSEWRARLKQSLPDYMLPMYFIRLEEMPLTDNGKIDKKNLPKPQEFGMAGPADFRAPTSELEAKIAEIWQEVLNRKNVGIEDDFFVLGGHSLKAVRISNAYFEQFGVKMPLQELFSNTTIAAQGKWISSATAQKYEPISPLPKSEAFPVSDAQRRLWILSQFEDSSVAYNMPGHVFLNETIEIESFEKAVLATIERHEVLRTVFKETTDGDLMQIIRAPHQLDFSIETIDLRGDHEQRSFIERYMEEDAKRPFDLENGPLIRAALFQTETSRFEFYYNTHHIISDGWSGEVLANDVFAFYTAYVNNEPTNLPALRIQYKEYASWQLQQLTSDAFESHRVFWKDQLSGELPVIDLPNYKQRPALKTHNGRGKRTFIDPISFRKLNDYTKENGGTLFMGLLTCWNVLMHRYTGQEDLIIGTPIAGRDHPDLENQIGFYVNTLALRNTLSSSLDTFDSFFRRVKENTLKCYSHQEYPFDRLVDELNLVRDTSRNAVFDIMVKLMNIADQDPTHPSVSNAHDAKNIIDLGWMPAKFDLEVSFQESGDGLSFELVYNSDVYNEHMILGLMHHFQHLLERIVDQSFLKLGAIDFLADAEKVELMNTFSGVKMHTDEFETIIDKFEKQAAKYPNKEAVLWENKVLSYKELNERSNQFADYLIQMYQIHAGDFVGIKLQRNEWLLIAILGTLKAGGAYVSIDPNYPQERIAFIENDTRAKVCVDANEIQKFIGNQREFSNENKKVLIAENQLAYIIYTSGSTGTPKGVMIPHRSVSAFINWSHKEFENTPVEEVLFTTSINFDLSIFEMFYPLTSGKSVRILKDGLAIPDYLESERNIMVNTVPSVVGTLLQEGVDFRKVTALNMAGEPIPQSYKEQLVGKVREIRNLYGPSEDTTYSTCMRVDLDQRDLIGKPIANTDIYVLNNSLTLQPVGVVGEICISGDGLALGYLNQEKLTAEKFIDHPFSTGAKCYKTGDLGRWLRDGNLQFVGRLDRQVKIRGYRIELNEISTELLAHEGIENGLVTTFVNQRNEKELVAYFTCRKEEGESSVSVELLRSYLKTKLPAYMVPSYYVELDQFPLTPNGKIDEKGLPAPDGNALNREANYVAANNEVEAKMVALWEDVLQYQPIGVTDDFFLLGGHSLKAVRIRNHYRKEFNVALSLKELFTNTTIQTQAELIRRATVSTFETIPVAPMQTTYPVSYGQERLWILSQLDAASAAYSISNTVDLSGEYDVERFRMAVDKTIDRHEILRTVFGVKEDGNLFQKVVSRQEINFHIDVTDLRDRAEKGETIQAYLESDEDTAFDLERGPLFRARLVQLADDYFLLHFNMHHIICDHWSMQVLFEDVMDNYERLGQAKFVEKEPLRIHYKDYAVWEQQELQSNRSLESRAFWLQKLRGELPVMDLPFTNERPAFRSFNGGIWSTIIESKEVTQLRTECQKNGGTLFHGLLAVWLVLIQKYTKETDLLIGTSVAGRNHADLEQQIGYYSNSIALRNSIDPTTGFTEVLRKIIESTTEAMHHQDYPFNKLVQELGVKRESNRNPIFDTMFVYNNEEGQRIRDDRKVNPEELEHIKSKAKFDLEISVMDMEQMLSFRIIYDSDVFESIHIKNMLLQFKLLLKELINKTELPIQEVNIEDTSRKEKKKMNLSKLMSKK